MTRGRVPPRPARALFSLLLLCYPRRIRTRYGPEMRQLFLDSYSDLTDRDGSRGNWRFWRQTYWGLLANALGARLDTWRMARTRGRARRRRHTYEHSPGLAERARDIARAVRHSRRSLARGPGFALTSILTLGLAIGACTTVFSVVYPVLVAPLPYPRAGDIVSLYEQSPGPDGRAGWASPLTVRDWQERSVEFERIVSYRLNIFTWTGDAEPALLRGWAVSPGYFPTLGLGMTLGRGFAAGEDRAGNDRVVVLSHALWQQQFGADPDVLGRSMTLDGAPYAIVGIAHPNIAFPSTGDYWIPLAFDYGRELRDFRYLGVIARVREGSTLAKAEAELIHISEQIAAEHPETNAGWSAAARGLKDTQVGYVRPILLGISVAVGLLLVIAVGNITNLAVARSAGRQTDVAVRRALGATLGAIARLCVTESVMVAVLGSALGVLLAAWGTGALSALALRSLPNGATIAVDLRALSFALGVALVVGLAMGLLSATTSTSKSLIDTLRAGGRGNGGIARVFRMREVILTAQVALALALLVGATLLAQSLYNLSRIDVGFSADNLVTFSYDLPAASYGNDESKRSFYAAALDQIRAIPGVEAVAAVTPIPLDMGSVPTSWSLSPDASPASDPAVMAHMRVVSPQYFEAMGIELLSGRCFDSGDRESTQQVALVNRAFVDRYITARDALGVRITAGAPDADDSEWSTIVGVVADVRFRSLTAQPEPEIYIPEQQFPQAWGHLVARAADRPDGLARAVTAAVQRVDPNLPLASVRTGADMIFDQFRASRVSATLTSLFAIISLVLAVVGTLGVLSLVVAQRTKELGLRMALGAESGDIWRFVLTRGMRPVAVGLALGTAVSLAATRLLGSQLHGVSAINALAFLVPASLLTGAGLLACLVPGVKASKLDPVGLLRSE